MSVAILLAIQNQLRFFGYLIFLILGNLGNLFIIIIFHRYRQNTCSIYLLTLAIINICYLTFNSLIEIIPFQYDNQINSTIILCKIRFYLSNVFGQIAKTILMLACIDRFILTNNQATIRTRSSPKYAKLLISFSIIFWFIFASHVLIKLGVVNKECRTDGIYGIVYGIYTLVFACLIPSIVLSLFGYLTYRNMKQIRNRVRPFRNNPIRRRDRELIIIVISEVFVYILTTIPYTLVLLELTISEYVVKEKGIEYYRIQNFIFTIVFLLLFVNNMAPFYIYLVVSKSFRQGFKQLFSYFYRRVRIQPTPQMLFTTNRCDTRV